MTVKEILDGHGIPYVESCQEYRLARVPTWDGKTLHMPGGVEQDPAWTLHEVGHWLVAPPASRALPNYGLGTDPGGGANVKRVVNATRGFTAKDVEAAVCLLGLYLLRKYGFEDLHHKHKEEYGVNGYGLELLDDCRSILNTAGLPADEIIQYYQETEPGTGGRDGWRVIPKVD